MKNIEFEVKIGLFVLTGIILLTVISFSIGDFFFKSGYHVYAQLRFANGVKEAAPVRLAGIEIGEVKEASVFKDEGGRTKVRLKLWLTKEAAVEKDAKVSINTLGLIGEKYVEIIPGSPGSELAVEEDILAGYDSISIDQITKKAYDVAVKLEKAVDTFDEILRQVKSGEGNVGMLLFDDSLYNEVEEMIEDLKAHPWKLLNKPRQPRRQREDDEKKTGNAGYF